MAEDWLDSKTLAILSQEPEGIDDDILEAPKFVPPNNVDFDSSRLKIFLPGSTHVESLHYVPPKYPFELATKEQEKKTVLPEFQFPEERFDYFEHFGFQWISDPNLESKT